MRHPLHVVPAACFFLAVVCVAEGFRGIRTKPQTRSEAAATSAASVGPLTNATRSEPEKKHEWNKFEWAKVKGPEVFGTCAALAGFGVLVSAAGVGGGGLYLAALMLIHGLSAHDAIPLSHAIVFFGATGSLLVNMRRWRIEGSYDIDLDQCRLVVPAALLGTVIGFVLNTRVPEQSFLGLLAMVLTVLIIVTLRIWWQQRQEETSLLPQQKQADLTVSASTGAPLLGGIDRWEVVLSLVLTVVVCVASVFRFHAIACRDTKEQFGRVTLEWLPVSCKHPALGFVFGQHMDDWLQNGVFMLWLEFIPVKICLTFMWYYGWRMRDQKGWTVAQVVGVQSVAMATGILSGLIGIGGGLIFSPYFLTSMDPLVAVGTSSTCLLFIAASATLQYAFTDRIIMSLAVAYGCVAFIASIFGTHTVSLVRNKLPSGKSFTTLIVAIVVILTNCLTISKLVVSDFLPIHA